MEGRFCRLRIMSMNQKKIMFDVIECVTGETTVD